MLEKPPEKARKESATGWDLFKIKIAVCRCTKKLGGAKTRKSPHRLSTWTKDSGSLREQTAKNDVKMTENGGWRQLRRPKKRSGRNAGMLKEASAKKCDEPES